MSVDWVVMQCDYFLKKINCYYMLNLFKRKSNNFFLIINVDKLILLFYLFYKVIYFCYIISK